MINGLDYEIRYCLYCGKEIQRRENDRLSDYKRRKFCNNSCSAKYNNPRTKKKTISTNNFCILCGKEIRKNGKFCNAQCQIEYQNKQRIENWKNGLMSGMNPDGSITKFVRRYILEKYNYKCAKCGWGEINPFTGNIPLDVHHKDGDHENNIEDNLEALCPNCHSLTENYKGANKGHGRQNRKKYYEINNIIEMSF